MIRGHVEAGSSAASPPGPAAAPVLTGVYEDDYAAVLDRLTELDRYSAHDARCVPAAERRSLVAAFLDRHANRFYAELTEHRTIRLTCPQLLAHAAQRYPRLLPAGDLPAGDQAVVLRGVLRDRESGNHLLDTMRMPDPANLARAADFDRIGRLELASVRVERRGAAGHVTLLNVDTLNAEDDQLVADLGVAVDVVMLAESVRVGVLRGGRMRHRKYAGRRVFCAGINLDHLAAGRISYLNFLIGREVGFLSKMTRGLRTPDGADSRGTNSNSADSHMPWIAVIDAFAIGGGLQMALAADHVIAEAGSYGSLPAAQEGIVPGVANLRLPRRVGVTLARDMILHGRAVHTADPDAGLLFDEVVEADGIDAAVERAVQRLAAPAVRANKQMLAVSVEPQDEFRAYIAEFAAVQAERMHADDVLAKVEARAS